MKKMKCVVLTLLKWLGLFTLMRHITRDGVRILCYHGIWLGDEGYSGDAMFMKQKTFELRMESLRRWRYPTVTLDQAVAGLSGAKLPSCSVVVTIDDGWFSTYSIMWPILHRLGIPATLYCDTAHLLARQPVPHVAARYIKILVESGFAGNAFASEVVHSDLYNDAIKNIGDTGERLVAVKRLAEMVLIDIDRYYHCKVFNYMQPEQLKKIFSEGLDVQLHTHNHQMHDFSGGELVVEIKENRHQLSQVLDIDVDNFKHFCYPSGQNVLGLGPVLGKLGIISSTTTEQSIAYPDNDMQYLPRILDGEHLAAIEFEAELCGVMDFFRSVRHYFMPNAFPILCR